jgi:hypothetical protein
MLTEKAISEVADLLSLFIAMFCFDLKLESSQGRQDNNRFIKIYYHPYYTNNISMK